MEDKIITQCPHCQSKFKLGSEKVGKKIKCPKCQGVFEVQEVAEQPKAAAQPAPKAAPVQPPKPKVEAAPAKPKVEVAPPKPKVEAAPPKPKVEAAPAKPKVEAAPPAPKPEPAPAVKEVVPIEKRPRPLKVRDFFETQHMRFLPEKAQGVDAHICYEITGDEASHWTLRIQNGVCEIKEMPDPSAKSQVKMSDKTYLKIATSKLDARVAFMLGKLKIKGDKASLATVRECFKVADVS